MLTPADWTLEDAAELYRLEGWSDDFFVVNEAGHVAVRPFDDDTLSIDLLDVVEEARSRGIARYRAPGRAAA